MLNTLTAWMLALLCSLAVVVTCTALEAPAHVCEQVTHASSFSSQKSSYHNSVHPTDSLVCCSKHSWQSSSVSSIQHACHMIFDTPPVSHRQWVTSTRTRRPQSPARKRPSFRSCSICTRACAQPHRSRPQPPPETADSRQRQLPWSSGGLAQFCSRMEEAAALTDAVTGAGANSDSSVGPTSVQSLSQRLHCSLAMKADPPWAYTFALSAAARADMHMSSP